MSTPESFEALRRANPRNEAGFAEAVDAAAGFVRTEIATAGDVAPPRRSRRRLLGLSAAAAALVVAAAVIAYSTIGSTGVQSASAAFEQATTLTAASAERSGTAVVRMTHDGKPWTGSTIRWNGDDIAVKSDMQFAPGAPGSAMLVLVPLALIKQFQSGAVDQQVHRTVRHRMRPPSGKIPAAPA